MNPEFDIPEQLFERLNDYLQNNLKGPELAAFRFLDWQIATAFANIEFLKDKSRESPEYNHALDEVERTLTLLRATCQDLGI